MANKIRTCNILILVLFILLSACRPSSSDTTLPVKVLAVSSHCPTGRTASALVPIRNRQTLDGLLKHLRQGSSGEDKSTAATDFATENVFLIDMGMRRSGGYGLKLVDFRAVLRDAHLLIPVQWIEPGPGSIVTQVITQPCLLFAVAKGDYRSVAIIDQQGRQRLMLKLK